MNIKAKLILKKPHRKRNELGIDILHEVAEHGKQSEKSLSKRLDLKESTINVALEKMEKKNKWINVIKLAETTGRRGRPQKYYGLTEKGIKFLVTQKISAKEFWKMMFFVFDESTNHKLKIAPDEVLSEYEIHNLHISKEHSPFYFAERLDGTDFKLISNYEHEKENYETIKKIIKLLGYEGPSTLIKIFKKLKINVEGQVYNSSDINEPRLIKRMMNDGLITKTNSNTYRLSHVGLLLLVNDIAESTMGIINHLSLSNEMLDQIKKRIDMIVSNNHKLLPMVFGKWEELKKIKDEVILFRMLRILYFKKKSDVIFPIQLGGIQELFDAQRSMEIVYRQKMKKMFVEGMQVLEEVINQKGINLTQLSAEELLSPPVLKLLDKRNDKNVGIRLVINGKLKTIQTNDIDPIREILKVIKFLSRLADEISSYDPFSTYRNAGLSKGEKTDNGQKILKKILRYRRPITNVRKTEQALADIISFQFYALLKNIPDHIDWDSFLDLVGLRDWYHSWMNAIIEFEEENLIRLRK